MVTLSRADAVLAKIDPYCISGPAPTSWGQWLTRLHAKRRSNFHHEHGAGGQHKGKRGENDELDEFAYGDHELVDRRLLYR
jgi:hypothetical protein